MGARFLLIMLLISFTSKEYPINNNDVFRRIFNNDDDSV